MAPSTPILKIAFDSFFCANDAKEIADTNTNVNTFFMRFMFVFYKNYLAKLTALFSLITVTFI